MSASTVPLVLPAEWPGPGTTKLSLSDGQQKLVALLQSIRYGRVHHLTVRAGQPFLSGDLGWTRIVKVLGDNGPHPSIRQHEFCLRREVIEFFRLLTAVGDGEISNLEVRNGLPFSFEVDETFSESP